MAYQVISQNNTTTTLADENGNIIRVPARVSLATSTDYTITKVNNSTATLEDGNGNIIRDVPCVAVLVGGEGGGGGTVDYSKTVQKTNTMPTADATNAGQVFMYTGATDSNYTQNYIYKNVKSATYTGTVSFEAATLSGTTVACSGDNFANFLTESGVEPLSVVSGTMTFDSVSELWVLVGKDSDGNTALTFQEYQQDYEDAGFTFTGTPQNGDVVAFTCTVEEASATYTWTRVDVQPTPEALPDQTGHSGEFLTTDGTDASWSDKPLVNNDTHTGSVSISSNTSGSYNTVLGRGSSSYGGNYNTVVGSTSQARNASVAIGVGIQDSTSQNAVIIRSGTQNMGSYVTGITDSFTWIKGTTQYELVSGDGTVPTARLTKVNSIITLTAAGWSSNTQTVSVTGMTATGVVLVSPDPTDQSAYTSAGIICTAQAADSLTFTCSTTPSGDIDVVVVML